jgi:hypothetical protein
MRSPLRTIGMKIEGINMMEAVRLSYYKLHEASNGQLIAYAGNMERETEMLRKDTDGLIQKARTSARNNS